MCTQAFFSASVFSQVLTTAPKKLFYKNINTGALSTSNSELQAALFSDNQSLIIALPLPNGTFVDFKLTLESVMADELARKLHQPKK